MFSVRIDRDADAYVFRVAEFETHTIQEMIAIDSTPALIAIVQAGDAGAAAARAWQMGEAEAAALAKLGGMPALLAEKQARATKE